MSKRICIFGEVLFDHFPDGARVLGGAPFNVAWHLQAFGQAPHFISRVGRDPEGEAVLEAMRAWGMDTSGVQRDPQLPTGRVDIQLIAGEPHYEIVAPAAYDAIEPPPAESADCRLLYHGSLALRSEISQRALAALKERGPEAVFVDVNLRPPWWRREQVLALSQGADWVKLNAEELALLAPEGAEDFLRAQGLRGLLMTRGSAGAELLTAGGERHTVRPDSDTTVVDTVGAGDAFASVMILGLVSGWPLDLTLTRAQSFASALVGQRGATVADPDFYRDFAERWHIETE